MGVKAREFVLDRRLRIKAIKDVVYEYANLMAAAYYSMHGDAPWRTNCDDAFLLGCRKLGDFLRKDKRSKRDDVWALDYLPTNATPTWELPIWTTEWRNAMNKQLAHITYFRDKEWIHSMWVPKLELEFNKAWWDFRETIANKDYSGEFDTQLAFCEDKGGFGNIGLRRR